MKKTFKVKGYEAYRKSENKIFTHAVIFGNSSYEREGFGATFHISLALAEKEAKNMTNNYPHITVREIVEVEEVTKAGA